LGVKNLYVNPIFSAKTVHRYDCVDYFTVDAHLGGNEALKRLSRDAHAAGLRVVLDVSINHTGSEHPWRVAARANPRCPESQFYFRQENGSLAGWMGVKNASQLNYRSERLRRSCGARGVRPAQMAQAAYSMDGWRFDVGNMTARRGKDQLSHEVFREVRRAVKGGEPRPHHRRTLAGRLRLLEGDEWDGLMNFAACARPLRSFCGERDRYWHGSPPDPVRGREASFRFGGGRHDRRALRAHELPFGSLLLNVLDTHHDLYRLHTFTDIYSPRALPGRSLHPVPLAGGAPISTMATRWAWMAGRRRQRAYATHAVGLRKWKRDFVVLYRLLEAAMRSSEAALRLGASASSTPTRTASSSRASWAKRRSSASWTRGQARRQVALPARELGISSVASLLGPSAGTALRWEGGRLLLDIGPEGSGVWKAGLEF
jgi:alpha-glucosidase